MKYIKFNDDIAYEAPFKKEVEGGTIYGYNASSNEAMLLTDGWLKYEGTAPLSHLRLVDGKITEIIIPIPEPEPVTFTKLQIRRALRSAGKEDMLDELLASDETVRKDWNDCMEVSLADPILNEALTPELKQQLLEILGG